VTLVKKLGSAQHPQKTQAPREKHVAMTLVKKLGSAQHPQKTQALREKHVAVTLVKKLGSAQHPQKTQAPREKHVAVTLVKKLGSAQHPHLTVNPVSDKPHKGIWTRYFGNIFSDLARFFSLEMTATFSIRAEIDRPKNLI
jgi:hypothetical protein